MTTIAYFLYNPKVSFEVQTDISQLLRNKQ